MRRLAVLTSGRQDWGILRSTCRLLLADPRFELLVLAGGMHLSPPHGRTLSLLEGEGVRVAERLSWLPVGELPAPWDQAGSALRLVGESLGRLRPEALLLTGDRLETAAAALAATVGAVPIAHLHGGEETEGAFDNQLRHAVTKMSHLHLVTHADHAARVTAMGEDPRTIHVVGAPGLDNAHRPDLPSRSELEADLGLPLRPPVVLVTLHPATLGEDPAREAEALADAMDAVPATYVVTLPNADPGAGRIRARLLEAASKPGRKALEALGERRYWGLLRAADAVLGNSSSGLIEAPLLGLPAVNVGDRQKGRLRGTNVLDAEPRGPSVAAALSRAISSEFRRGLDGTSPYGDGRSADRIARILARWTPPVPPRKSSAKR